MVRENNQIIIIFMAALDLAVTLLAWLLCFWIRFQSGWMEFMGPAPRLADLTDFIVITLLLVVLVFSHLGLYHPRRILPIRWEFADVLKACAIVWAMEVFIGHFIRSPRLSIKLQLLMLVLWPTMLIAYRASARVFLHAMRARGYNLRSVAIVNAGRTGQKLVRELTDQRWMGYRIAYFVNDSRIGERMLDIPIRGPIEEVEQILDAEPVDAVFICLPRDEAARTDPLLNTLSDRLVDVLIVPDLISYQLLRHQVQQIGTLPVVNLTHNPQTGWNAAAKRLFDVLGALLMLLLCLPLMALIAAAIKLTSHGPIFYRQRRASLGGHEFTIIKFRSMIEHPDQCEQGDWSVDGDDPRITRVGRVLRKLSLDELPQLINVLRGDMSLVGPRPERPEFIRRFRRQIPRYSLRHHVKAGLTGWAQVNGYRGGTSLHKRIQYDLDYINRWSLGFDLWILLMTLFSGFYNRHE